MLIKFMIILTDKSHTYNKWHFKKEKILPLTKLLNKMGLRPECNKLN